jgi:tetratricopeptide (TPR) repeat protein
MLSDPIAGELAAGRFHRAIKLCNVALNRSPTHEHERRLRLQRAEAFSGVSAWSAAELDCRRVLEHGADARGHALLARALFEQRRTREAASYAEAALGADASNADQWQLYAEALSAEQLHEPAVRAAAEARRRHPNSSTALTLLCVLSAAGRHEEVIALAAEELRTNAEKPELWVALATSSSALGRSEAAITAYRRALDLAPERVEAACGLGFLLLKGGLLAEGFRLNEHRQGSGGARRRLGVQPWSGESLEKKHLLVWCEQGMGDVIQFARFMRNARATATRTTLMVPRALARLLASCPELGPIASQHPGFGAADYQCLVMSLPHLLKLHTPAAIVSASSPCLFAESALVERWRTRLPRGPKVALAWQGNPKYAGDRWRSMPFAHFASLLERQLDRVSFVSLQKCFGNEQLEASPLAALVKNLAAEIDSAGDAFVDSLAVLSVVDLFITTDSAIAHVAGAAGIRTWLLLGQAADWRWGLAGDRTPWYPSMRLFRQQRAGDWAEVIERVGNELSAVLAEPTVKLVHANRD